jgi:pimeloyl-ACP methyl ester carboxylesterase
MAEMTEPPAVSEVTGREQRQIDRANSTGKTPVVFIHGLWLLPSSWDNWVGLFEENGYTGLTLSGRMTRKPWRRRAPTQTSSRRRPSSRSPTMPPM